MHKLMIGFMAAALWASGLSAAASTITRTYTFAFQNFQPLFAGDPAPVDPLTGSFTVTLDPAVAVRDVSAGLTVHSPSLPIVGPFAFSYNPLGLLAIGAIVAPFDTVAGVVVAQDDLVLAFRLETPTFATAFYTRAGKFNAWSTNDGSFVAFDGAPGVPEPSTWLMIIMGLGSLGAILRSGAGGLRRLRAHGVSS
jgi:hypothetical protein